MKIISKTLQYILLIAFFISCSFVIISYASGYKLDLTKRNFVPTSLVSIITDSQENQIYLNNESYGKGRVVVRDLKKGDYDLTVKRDGYLDWSRKIILKADEAQTINDVILFKVNPQSQQFDDSVKKEDVVKLADITGLIVNSSGEIYNEGNLVTRYSADVKGLCWYEDRRYISFTMDGKLNIIDLEGMNRFELLDKDSDTPVLYIDSGRSVVYEHQGKLMRANIR